LSVPARIEIIIMVFMKELFTKRILSGIIQKMKVRNIIFSSHTYFH